MRRINVRREPEFSKSRASFCIVSAGLAVFLVIGIGPSLSGCGSGAAQAALLDTPTETQAVMATLTPNITPTPVPTPTPSPSPTPYVELTKEQKIELLDIQDPVNKYSISQIGVLEYKVDGCVFFALTGCTTSAEPNDMDLYDYFSGYNLFISPESNIMGIDIKKTDMHKFGVLAPGYLGKEVEFIKLFTIDNLEKELAASDITPGESKYSSRIANFNAIMSANEVGEYIVDVVPQANIPFPYLFLGIEPYTTPSPTIQPTN